MKLTEPKAVRDVHEIRERLHEEDKNLSDAELLAKWHEAGRRLAKQLGLQIVPAKTPEPNRKHA